MQQVFHYYQDSSHGWVKVKKSILEELGISHEISKFSYMKGEYAYLEEDSDSRTFILAYEKINGKRPTFNESHSNKSSKICSYEDYAVEKV